MDYISLLTGTNRYETIKGYLNLDIQKEHKRYALEGLRKSRLYLFLPLLTLFNQVSRSYVP